jgi:phosphomannomutase
VFAGEMSGHFYFRDFYYADNGLIPFLLMLELISKSGKKVSELLAPFLSSYFISGEINTKLVDQSAVSGILDSLEERYQDARIEKIDGLSLGYEAWRANVRGSNTEPLVRLNVEAKDEKVLREKIDELLEVIKAHA